MATIIDRFLLVIFVICLNSSTFGETRGIGLNESKINILFVSIVNDLPPGSGQLSFVSNVQEEPYVLEPGKPYTRFSNFEPQHCIIAWNTKKAKFDLYDPTKEEQHQRIFWSARIDGIYHSWDEATWDKRMRTSIGAALLVVLTVCLMNGWSYAESDSNDTNINLLSLSILNGMARNSPDDVHLYYNHEANGVYLHPGQSFFKLDNLNPKSVVMYWNTNCASFMAYDPSLEGNHQKIFWLVKEDVCFNTSTFVDSLPPILYSNRLERDSNVHMDINILFLSIVNDLIAPKFRKIIIQ
ncbi:hypothetical protein CR513_44639, partial [Mucuna pruriens]